MINCVAIIPARGGSKGIPGKNLACVCGKPLLAWTIEAALSAGHVGHVVVSTDSAEIACAARVAGAEVVERPADISGDLASSEAALLHTLDALRAQEGTDPESLVFLQCTAPLTRAEDIDGTLEAMSREGADSAVAVTDFHYFLWKEGLDGGGVGVNHDKSRRVMRQEQEPQYLETGAVYAMRTAGFREAKHRFFGKTALYHMPPERCWEIDEPRDLVVAESLMRLELVARKQALLPAAVDAVIYDFDGVFTTNTVYVDEVGRESVRCSRGDGMGVALLREAGIPQTVLSTEKNPVVAARCAKLALPCTHGVADKTSALRAWAQEEGYDLGRLVYLGNDVNDIGCLEAVGCPVAVKDAHPEVLRRARIVLESKGGRGAVRELAELLLKRR